MLARRVQDRMAVIMGLLGSAATAANDDGTERQHHDDNDDGTDIISEEVGEPDVFAEPDVVDQPGGQDDPGLHVGLDLEEAVGPPSPDLEDEAVGRAWFGGSTATDHWELGCSAAALSPEVGLAMSGPHADSFLRVPAGGAGLGEDAVGEGGFGSGELHGQDEGPGVEAPSAGSGPSLGSGASGTAAGRSLVGSGAPGTAAAVSSSVSSLGGVVLGDPPAGSAMPVLPPPDPGEQYEALVRQRPSRRIGSRMVVESGSLQWCLVCRAASHTGGLGRLPAECSFERVRASFAGDAARIQLPHDVVYIHGAVVCLRCGACSTSRLFKLAGAKCQASAFGAKELRRILGGGLPSNLHRWPLPPGGPGPAEQPAPALGPARPRRCRTKSTPPTSST